MAGVGWKGGEKMQKTLIEQQQQKKKDENVERGKSEEKTARRKSCFTAHVELCFTHFKYN